MSDTSIDAFVGSWTYRSFYNKPEPVDDFNDIRLWQADLVLERDGPFFLKGSLSSGGYTLRIHGTVFIVDGARVVRFRAEGLSGTNTQGWIYDYEGQLSLNWPDGADQRPAIVGSVIRTAPHDPGRQAGIVYSFVAVSKDVPTPRYELPNTVVEHFASRLHRLHHAVWHGLRNGWNDLDGKTQAEITRLDWAIDGGRTALFRAGEKTRPCTENGSGEDFLFFHRQMVVMYRMLMQQANAEIIEWKEIPQPGQDTINVVPSGWTISGAPQYERRFAVLKSDEFFWSRMRWWEFKFKDPMFLSTLNLGQLGALLEFSVHNDMHMRWASIPRDPVTNEILPLGRDPSDVADKWDSPSYNWLGDFYSSHVNPIFWRLHGWIDDRINDWYNAHQSKMPGSVIPEKKGGVDWFETGDWVDVENPWVWPKSLGGFGGGHHHPGPQNGDEQRRKSLEEVVKVLYPNRAAVLAVGGKPVSSLRMQRELVLPGF